MHRATGVTPPQLTARHPFPLSLETVRQQASAQFLVVRQMASNWLSSTPQPQMRTHSFKFPVIQARLGNESLMVFPVTGCRDFGAAVQVFHSTRVG